MELSLPKHFTLSNHMGPVPAPNTASFMGLPPVNPSCRHATSAAALSQKSSQIVPHSLGPCTYTSSLPEYWSLPPLNRTCLGSVEAKLSCLSQLNFSFTNTFNACSTVQLRSLLFSKDFIKGGPTSKGPCMSIVWVSDSRSYFQNHTPSQQNYLLCFCIQREAMQVSIKVAYSIRSPYFSGKN